MPHDTHDRGQRASRPVPFDAAGNLWAAVQQGVIVSSDLNGRMEFVPLVPPIVRCDSPPPPPQRSFQPPPLPPVRTPLGEVSLNVLCKEIDSLEKQNAALKRHVKLQDKIIDGFCGLRMAEREN